MRRITLVLMMMIAGMAGSAVAATISNAAAKQRYPWNGKVDITYTLTGDVTAGLPAWNMPRLFVTASNRASAATATPSTTLTTDSRVRIG